MWISRTWTTTLAARLISEIVLSLRQKLNLTASNKNYGFLFSCYKWKHEAALRTKMFDGFAFDVWCSLQTCCVQRRFFCSAFFSHTNTHTHAYYYLSHTIRLCLLFQLDKVARGRPQKDGEERSRRTKKESGERWPTNWIAELLPEDWGETVAESEDCREFFNWFIWW